jgi:hypothetical protein
MLYQPWPEPIVRKHKSAAAALALASRKALKKWRGARGSSYSGTHTSTQELALAKPVKPSKKFVAQSSRLNVTKKTSSTNVKIVGKKTYFTCAGGSDATQASARALDLFDSSSSASDGEAAIPAPPRKRPKNVLKPSGPSVVKVTFGLFLSLHLF